MMAEFLMLILMRLSMINRKTYMQQGLHRANAELRRTQINKNLRDFCVSSQLPLSNSAVLLENICVLNKTIIQKLLSELIGLVLQILQKFSQCHLLLKVFPDYLI